MKVSVAMATYNGVHYVSEQLLSIIRQTRQPDEIIIVDDASTDDTVNVLSALCKKNNIHIKLLVNNTNLGVCKTFDRAIRQCSGDILFLADQDDFWYPAKIEKMLDVMTLDHTLGCCISDVDLADECLKPLGLSMNESVLKRGRQLDDRVMGAASCFRSSLIKFATPIPQQVHSHDKWLVTIANYLDCKKLIHVSYQKYRLHENNVVGDVRNLTARPRVSNTLHRIKGLLNKSKTGINLKRDLTMLSEIFQLFSSEVLKNDHVFLNEIRNALPEIQKKLALLEARVSLQNLSLMARTLRVIRLRLSNGKTYSCSKIFQDMISG
jgi:glycosyltransferase involved in cell wall biosynthesis